MFSLYSAFTFKQNKITLNKNIAKSENYKFLIYSLVFFLNDDKMITSGVTIKISVIIPDQALFSEQINTTN